LILGIFLIPPFDIKFCAKFLTKFYIFIILCENANVKFLFENCAKISAKTKKSGFGTPQKPDLINNFSHTEFNPLMPSRKKVIRTPILRGGFLLSTSLKYSVIRQDYLRFCLAQSKIRSLKILRPEKNRILSRF